MQYKSYLILFCLSCIQGERSVYGIYHLLKGKKSSQTIQDAKLYNTSFLFQTFPNLKRNELIRIVDDLQYHHFIQAISQDCFILTKKGHSNLKKWLQKNPFPKYLNGWDYGSIAIVFWKRFSLLTQSLAHLLKQEQHFLPVSRDSQILDWTKGFFKYMNMDRKVLGGILFEECYSILSQLDSTDADIFSLRLSGSHRVGLTNQQVAEMFKMDEDKLHLLFLHVLHFFIEEIQLQKDKYPVLASIIKDQESEYPFTNSTKETYLLLMKNKSIDEIAALRRLKRSTVEDHIIEIALNDPTFTIEAYVPKNTQEQILKRAKEVGSKRMKPIKEGLNDLVTYFQIRLVLSKEGVKGGT